MSNIAAATILIVADTDMRIVRVNDVYISDSGLADVLPDSISSLNLLDHIDDLGREEAEEICQTIITGKKFPSGALSYKKVVTTSEILGERWVLLLGPYPGGNRNVEGVVYAKFRSTVYDELPKRDLDPEKFYEYLVKRSSDMVVLADDQGCITFANQAVELYTGISARDIVGKHFSEVVHPDDVDKVRETLNATVNYAGSLSVLQCRFVALDNVVRHFAVNTSVIKTQNGDRVLCICRDVTESAQLREKLIARNSALSAANEIVIALASSDTLEDGLQISLDKVLHELGLDKGSISLVERNGDMRVRVQSGYDENVSLKGIKCPLAQIACKEAGDLIVMNSIATDERIDAEFRNMVRELGVEAVINVPLRRAGEVVAVICLVVQPSAELSLEQMELITLVGGILGPAIENARLHNDLAERVGQLDTLNQLAKSVNSDRDVNGIMSACLKEIVGMVNFTTANLFFVYEKSQAEIYSYDNGKFSEVASKPVSNEQIEMIRTLKNPIVYRDLANEKPCGINVPTTGSALFVPLMGNRETFGALKLYHVEPNIYGERELNMMKAVAEHLAIAASNARLFELEKIKSLELEALAREAHHRIKNNLQMVTGLLNISGSDNDSNGMSASSRCLRQIRAIATVHDLLSPKSKRANLELCECLSVVAEQALTGMGCSDTVKLKVNGDEAWVMPEAATALGIIVNELVCNCVEHGFPNNAYGKVSIDIKLESKKTTVIVRDDGVGLPTGFTVPKNPDSGLGLVTSLAEYGLGGSLCIEKAGQGTRAIISF